MYMRTRPYVSNRVPKGGTDSGPYPTRIGGYIMQNIHYELLFLSPTSLRILIELYRNSNQSETVQISIKEISDNVSLAKSSVREHLKNLEYHGFITVEQAMDSIGRQLPKCYHLTIPFGDFVRLLFTK